MNAIICGGGTAGHITPGLSIAEIISNKEKDSDILFVGRTDGEENRSINERGYKLRTINIYPIERKITIKNIKSIFALKKALSASKKIINEFNPDIVIGTGGYVCWPMIKAAQSMNIPTVLHESNTTPGLATKTLSEYATQVMLNFSQTQKELKRKDNISVVGNPIPENFSKISRTEARKRLGIKDGTLFILSFGGSGGAKKINDVSIKMMRNFCSKATDINHIHATGRKYYDEIKKALPSYSKGYMGCKIVDYINDMALYMKAADIVISRCGAMTISEIIECGCVPILIPSPNVTNNHQYKNAKILTDTRCALMIEESELNEASLTDAVTYLKNNKAERIKIKNNLQKNRKTNT